MKTSDNTKSRAAQCFPKTYVALIMRMCIATRLADDFIVPLWKTYFFGLASSAFGFTSSGLITSILAPALSSSAEGTLMISLVVGTQR